MKLHVYSKIIYHPQFSICQMLLFPIFLETSRFASFYIVFIHLHEDFQTKMVSSSRIEESSETGHPCFAEIEAKLDRISEQVSCKNNLKREWLEDLGSVLKSKKSEQIQQFLFEFILIRYLMILTNILYMV